MIPIFYLLMFPLINELIDEYQYDTLELTG